MWTSRTLHFTSSQNWKRHFQNQTGLYRGDGLALLRNLKGQQIDKVKKNIIGVFKDIGFRFEIETNLKEVDFLDVSLILQNGTYGPYKKSNNRLFYLHNSSNHPPHLIKQIPNSIQHRLSKNSSNEEIFITAKCKYEDALKKVSPTLILNTPKINDKNQKIDLEILFGLTHHSTKQYPQMLQKFFFDWSTDIFESLIDYIKFSTETRWRLATAVRIMSKIIQRA